MPHKKPVHETTHHEPSPPHKYKHRNDGAIGTSSGIGVSGPAPTSVASSKLHHRQHQQKLADLFADDFGDLGFTSDDYADLYAPKEKSKKQQRLNKQHSLY